MPHLVKTPTLLTVLLVTVSWSQAIGEVNLEKTRTNKRDGAKMVLVPAGRFLMGSTAAEVDPQFVETGLPVAWKTHTKDESPRHARSIDAFYMYRYEVTNSQYHKFTAATGHRTPPPTAHHHARCVQVSPPRGRAAVPALRAQ